MVSFPCGRISTCSTVKYQQVRKALRGAGQCSQHWESRTTWVFILGYFIWSMKVSAIFRAEFFSSAFAPLPERDLDKVSAASAAIHAGEFCTLTFPDKDLPIGAVVQDEAVVPDQHLFSERTLLTHRSDRHGTRRVGHLTSRKRDTFATILNERLFQLLAICEYLFGLVLAGGRSHQVPEEKI